MISFVQSVQGDDFMDAIKLSAWVGEDKRLVIDLPAEIPVGQVDIVIIPRESVKPVYSPDYSPTWIAKREEFRNKLAEAGMLSTAYTAPPSTIPLSPNELLEVGALPPGARPTDELVGEDRGPH
jgi:hypothetical protein